MLIGIKSPNKCQRWSPFYYVYHTLGVESIIWLNGTRNKEEILKILEQLKQSLIFFSLPHFWGQDSIKYGGIKERWWLSCQKEWRDDQYFCHSFISPRGRDVWKVKVLVTQSCLTLCDPMDYSPPGSSVHRILQARTLEWVAISFSRGSSQSRDWSPVSCMAGGFFTIWATREGSCVEMHIWSWGIPFY